MRNKLQKKAQKTINKSTRAFNKNLLVDNLWRGRFYVHQIDANWKEFEDKSGGELKARMEIRDKKTGLYHSFFISNYGIYWKLFEEINKFIGEDSGVWENIDLVKNDTTDWTKVKWKPIKEIF